MAVGDCGVIVPVRVIGLVRRPSAGTAIIIAFANGDRLTLRAEWLTHGLADNRPIEVGDRLGVRWDVRRGWLGMYLMPSTRTDEDEGVLAMAGETARVATKRHVRDAHDAVRKVRLRLPSYSGDDRELLEKAEDNLRQAQDRLAEALREAAESGKVD